LDLSSNQLSQVQLELLAASIPKFRNLEKLVLSENSEDPEENAVDQSIYKTIAQQMIGKELELVLDGSWGPYRMPI
jgi:hypothetical protein